MRCTGKSVFYEEGEKMADLSLKKSEAIGYLPDEKPTPGRLFLYALQQVIVMFPATIAVALITGFQVSTTIFASGLSTLCFIMISGKKIPLYYGSSFAYLTAISSMQDCFRLPSGQRPRKWAARSMRWSGRPAR